VLSLLEDQSMARQPVVIVNGQEVIPASQVPASQAVQVIQPVWPVHSYVVQRTQLVPVQYRIPWESRVVMYRQGQYVFLVNEPPISNASRLLKVGISSPDSWPCWCYSSWHWALSWM
jgi:hypothetical protein